MDLYLAVEAEFYLAIGGYDLDRITGTSPCVSPPVVSALFLLV
ncbi:MAG: hypothetical protein AB1776_01760 [Bacillota bacterium]